MCLRPHAHIDREFYVIVETFEATAFCYKGRFAIISLDEFWDTVRETYDERLIKEVGKHAQFLEDERELPSYPVDSISSIIPIHLNLPLNSVSVSALRHHADHNLTAGLALSISFNCCNVSFVMTNIIGIEKVSPSVVLENKEGSSPGSQVLIISTGGMCECPVDMSVTPGMHGKRNLSEVRFNAVSAYTKSIECNSYKAGPLGAFCLFFL